MTSGPTKVTIASNFVLHKKVDISTGKACLLDISVLFWPPAASDDLGGQFFLGLNLSPGPTDSKTVFGFSVRPLGAESIKARLH